MNSTVPRSYAPTSLELRQYATFYVNGMYFGIDVLNVQEVLRAQEMTLVPLAPAVIEGLINLRGQIVTAIDMRRRLKFAARENGSEPINVVIRSEDGAVSLLVDEIGDVVEVNQSSFEPPPVNMAPAHRSLIEGIYKLDDALLLILNTEQVLKLSETQV